MLDAYYTGFGCANLKPCSHVVHKTQTQSGGKVGAHYFGGE